LVENQGLRDILSKDVHLLNLETEADTMRQRSSDSLIVPKWNNEIDSSPFRGYSTCNTTIAIEHSIVHLHYIANFTYSIMIYSSLFWYGMAL
jgi:hypothetical protein